MIIQLYDDDMLNGEGIREVVFLQGCPHHCKGCFSPETWGFKEDTEETREKTIAFRQRLVHKLQQPYISGITITGGDPLDSSNVVEALELAKIAKKYGKNVWIYTGFDWDEIKDYYIMEFTDVVCDRPFIESLKSPTKPWVGSQNQRVIDVKKSLKQDDIVLWK